MFTRRTWLLASFVAFTLVAALTTSSTWAQSLQQRIDGVRQSRAVAEQPERETQAAQARRLRERMRIIIEVAEFQDITARQAFNWWSEMTRVPMVIDWNAMEMEGVDPDQPINLRLSSVPAEHLLRILMQQTSGDVAMMYELTPWYVQVMTKNQANRDLKLRVYEVQDLVMDVPNFEAAPSFDLNDALSNTNSGGSSGGGSGGGGTTIFGDDEQDQERGPTKAERGQALAQMVMDTIEPTLWVEVDGANVRYFNGRLIVNAPLYVHRQIGIPSVRAYDDYGSSWTTTPRPATGVPPVATVDSHPTKVGAVDNR